MPEDLLESRKKFYPDRDILVTVLNTITLKM